MDMIQTKQNSVESEVVTRLECDTNQGGVACLKRVSSVELNGTPISQFGSSVRWDAVTRLVRVLCHILTSINVRVSYAERHSTQRRLDHISHQQNDSVRTALPEGEVCSLEGRFKLHAEAAGSCLKHGLRRFEKVVSIAQENAWVIGGKRLAILGNSGRGCAEDGLQPKDTSRCTSGSYLDSHGADVRTDGRWSIDWSWKRNLAGNCFQRKPFIISMVTRLITGMNVLSYGSSNLGVSVSPISLPTRWSTTVRHCLQHFHIVRPKLLASFGVSRVGLIPKEAS